MLSFLRLSIFRTRAFLSSGIKIFKVKRDSLLWAEDLITREMKDDPIANRPGSGNCNFGKKGEFEKQVK